MSKNSIGSKILAIEMELHLAEQDLDVLNADLAYLEKTYVTMDYGVNFLRKEAPVVSINEYRRIIVDMSYVHTKIRSIKNSMAKLEKAISNKLRDLDYYYKYYEQELYEVKVLEFRKINER